MAKSKEEIEKYKTVFKDFKQRFLVEKKSIFDLSDCNKEENQNGDCCVFTQENVEYLVENFVKNGYGGDASFIEKIKYQLITRPTEPASDNNIVKGAIEVLATAYWLWRLVPINPKIHSTEKGVDEILKLIEVNPTSITKNKIFFNKSIKGIASVGTYYNTNKPFELAFIIEFFNKYLKNEKQELDNKTTESRLLNSIIYDNKIGYMQIKTASENKKAKLLMKGANKHKFSDKEDKNLEPIKSVSIYNALLYFFEPDSYEAIVSNDHKKRIIQAFDDRLIGCDPMPTTNDKKIECIKENLLKQFSNLVDEEHVFYKDEIRELWDPSILPAKNVIYYGAPGTGKTYEVTQLVKRKTKNDKCLYKVVQFHPSYGYEDFIDGVKPVGNNGGNLQLDLVNGIFKNMCIEAFKELERNKEDPEQAKIFYFIADEINRAELSRVFGELLLCLEEDKRLRFEKDQDTNEIELKGELIKTQNSILWSEKHAVVKIDKKNCENELDNGLYFGVPENIYFLGTMNDIDRSIDSFDLALRRRFKWVYKDCNYDVITNNLLENDANDETIIEYLSDGKEKGIPKGRCLLLNEYISDTLNLGKSYKLGHTYFMKIKVRNSAISKTAYENLFDQEIGPLVTEYLRAEYPDGKELEKKLKEMRNLFTLGKTKVQHDTDS